MNAEEVKEKPKAMPYGVTLQRYFIVRQYGMDMAIITSEHIAIETIISCWDESLMSVGLVGLRNFEPVWVGPFDNELGRKGSLPYREEDLAIIRRALSHEHH